MRIAICEDFKEDARQINELLTRYLETNGLAAEVDFFNSGEQFLSAFEPGKYQIIFMDIYLKKDGLSGMDAAAKVKRADQDAAVILVTTSKEHGIAGYKVAVYYIVKPIDEAEFAIAMEKCRGQLERFAKTIEIIADRQTVKLRLRDIVFVESLGRACVFSLTEDKITVSSMAMTGLVEKLGGFPFAQCHRSYIVNLLHVKEAKEKEFIMQNGRSVPISRTYRAAAHKAFREFFWNRIQGRQLG